MTTRKWYAIQYAYGSTVINHGLRGDKVISFESPADRDGWVSDGSEIMGDGERASVPASDPLVRSAIKYDNLYRVGEFDDLRKRRTLNS